MTAPAPSAANFVRTYYDASYFPGMGAPPVVVDPDPTLTSLVPNTSVVLVPVTVTLTGTGFLPTSVVQIDGTAIPTTFVSATSLTVDATPPVAGVAQVTVENSLTSESNALPYTVTEVVGDATTTTTTRRKRAAD